MIFAKNIYSNVPLLVTASIFITITHILSVHRSALRCFPLFRSSPEIDIWWKLTSGKMNVSVANWQQLRNPPHVFRAPPPLRLRPRRPAGGAATGCAWECPAPVSAARFSSAACGSRPAAAGPAAGSAGPSGGPCPGSSSPQCCSSPCAAGTLHCPCWCCACWQRRSAAVGAGRMRTPGKRHGDSVGPDGEQTLWPVGSTMWQSRGGAGEGHGRSRWIERFGEPN